MQNSAHNPKLVGEAIEALFTYEMKKRGITVSTPAGDSARYDRMVDRGPNYPHDGLDRHVSVQVRGALRRMKGCYCYHVKTQAHDLKLSPVDADVLAAYVATKDTWYLIPVSLFSPKDSITLYPDIASRKARFEHCRENWDLLAPGRANINIFLDWITRVWHPRKKPRCEPLQRNQRRRRG